MQRYAAAGALSAKCVLQHLSPHRCPARNERPACIVRSRTDAMYCEILTHGVGWRRAAGEVVAGGDGSTDAMGISVGGAR